MHKALGSMPSTIQKINAISKGACHTRVTGRHCVGEAGQGQRTEPTSWMVTSLLCSPGHGHVWPRNTGSTQPVVISCVNTNKIFKPFSVSYL